MQSKKNRATLVVKDGWVMCPTCRHRTHQHIGPQTEAQRLEVWCHRCKSVHVVNIASGQCYLDSPCR